MTPANYRIGIVHSYAFISNVFTECEANDFSIKTHSKPAYTVFSPNSRYFCPHARYELKSYFHTQSFNLHQACCLAEGLLAQSKNWSGNSSRVSKRRKRLTPCSTSTITVCNMVLLECVPSLSPVFSYQPCSQCRDHLARSPYSLRSTI